MFALGNAAVKTSGHCRGWDQTFPINMYYQWTTVLGRQIGDFIIPPIFQKEEPSLKSKFLYTNTSRHSKSRHQNPLVILDYSSQLLISSVKRGLLTLLSCRLASHNSINLTSYWNTQNTACSSNFVHLETSHLRVFL